MRTSRLLLFCLAIANNLYSIAQVPVLLNYPLVKGFYTEAIKDGPLLHCRTDFGLITWDVSDPAVPVELSHYPVPSYFKEGNMDKVGTTVYLVKQKKLTQVDMTNPAAPVGQPVPLGSFQINDVKSRGNVMYMARSTVNGLAAYDVTVPSLPLPLDSVHVPYPRSLQVVDTFLFAHTDNGVYRFGIGSAVPLLLDSIIIPYEWGIQGIRSNARYTFVMLVTSFMDNLWQMRIYDMNVPGQPVVMDTISVPITSYGEILAVTDSLLVFNGEGVKTYSIADPQNIYPVDALGPTYYPQAWLAEGDTAYAMNGAKGFQIWAQDAGGHYTLAYDHRVSDALGNIHVSASGSVFVEGRDSTYRFGTDRAGSSLHGTLTYPTRASRSAVFGNLLVEISGQWSTILTLSDLSDTTLVDSLSTIQFTPAFGTLYMRNIRIWNDRLFVGSESPSGFTSNIYDIADLANPVLLATGVPGIFDGQYNGVLYDYNRETGALDLYDAGTVPPQFIKHVALGVPCPGFGFWDPQRPLCHVVQLHPTAHCYSQIDLSDTASISVHGPEQVAVQYNWEWEDVRVWNELLYMPGNINDGIAIYGTCEGGGLVPLPSILLSFNPISIALTDSLLFVAFSGYVARYDVSGMDPCLTIGTADHPLDEGTFTVFPNPSTGSVRLNLPRSMVGGTVSVFSSTGRLVVQQQLTGSGTELHAAMYLPPGFYLIRIADDRSAYSTSMVIER